jgi:hypothetical protein
MTHPSKVMAVELSFMQQLHLQPQTLHGKTMMVIMMSILLGLLQRLT